MKHLFDNFAATKKRFSNARSKLKRIMSFDILHALPVGKETILNDFNVKQIRRETIFDDVWLRWIGKAWTQYIPIFRSIFGLTQLGHDHTTPAFEASTIQLRQLNCF